MSDEFLFVGGIVVVLGLAFGYRAWRSYRQSRRLSSFADGRDSGDVVDGTVEVREPASPQRPGPAEADDDRDAAPALWLWRVRRERAATGSKRAGSTRWETVESGVAAGSFAVRDKWDRIEVDASSVATTPSALSGTTGDREGTVESVDDPFESDRFVVGDPEIDVSLGDPSLPQRLADAYLPVDLDVTLSLGTNTSTPDRYQATVIRDHDELLVRGSLDTSADPPTLTGTETAPLVIVSGNPGQIAATRRRKALTQLAIGIAFALAGAGTVAFAVI